MPSAHRWIRGTDEHAIVIGVGNTVLQRAAELLADVRIGQSEIVIDRADGRHDFGAYLMRFLLFQ